MKKKTNMQDLKNLNTFSIFKLGEVVGSEISSVQLVLPLQLVLPEQVNDARQS